MILTVTLNPAVDKTCEAGRLLPGEVNRMKNTFSMAGGKGINVTKILRQFHLPVAATGFLGGYGGRLIEDAMMSLGAECHFIRTEGETRTNLNILGDDGYVTEFLEPGPEISEKELEIFRKEFTFCLELCDLVILSGSIPGGVPEDIYAQLTRQCRAEGRKVILDASGESLRQGAEAKPYLIKPNRKEMEFLVGKKLPSKESIVSEAEKLVKGGIEKVVVSLGAEGLLYVDGEKTLFEPARKVETVNTVGCGDSVVASFAMSIIAGETPDIAMRKAAALAAANASTRESGCISMHTYLELL